MERVEEDPRDEEVEDEMDNEHKVSLNPLPDKVDEVSIDEAPMIEDIGEMIPNRDTVETPAEEEARKRRRSAVTSGINRMLIHNSIREDTGKRADISIATIEEIANRKREARLERRKRQRAREDRLMNEAMERDRERKEQKDMVKQERDRERVKRRTETSILYAEYDELLLQDAEDEISTSDISDESELSLFTDPLAYARDIFASLEDMPSLSELTLSTDDMILDNRYRSVYSSASTYEDVGRFVDPLTGDPLDSTESTSSEIELPQLVEAEECIAYEDNDTLSFSLEDEPIFERPKSLKSLDDSVVDHEAVLLNFKLSQTVLKRDDTHRQDVIRTSSMCRTHQVITDFVQFLLKYVISHAEDAASKASLSRRLDIQKLYTELHNVVEEYLIEKYRNNFLNNKITDYFRRMDMTRHMYQLSYSDERRERRRYKEALIRLDLLNERAAKTKLKCADLMASVLMELESSHAVCTTLDARLQALVQKTINAKDSEHLTKVVDRELRFLNQIRNELDDFRVHLLTKNHSLARYDEKISHIAAINDDVNMDTFLLVQNQCITLGRKLEEKTVNLNSMHNHYYEELHTLAHIREKSSEISEQLQLVHTEYKTKHAYQLQLHEQLFKLKMERDNVRKELRNLNFQGGLLFHHGLMIDFDDTVEKINKLKTLVQKQKNNLQQLESKFEGLSTPKDRI